MCEGEGGGDRTGKGILYGGVLTGENSPSTGRPQFVWGIVSEYRDRPADVKKTFPTGSFGGGKDAIEGH